MSVLPKEVYAFSTILIKILTVFSSRNGKIHLKFTWTLQGPQMSKAVLEKNITLGGLQFPDFKTSCKATVIKTVWYRHKDRHIDQYRVDCRARK